MEWTNGVWSFMGEGKRKIGHPAPFPVELPGRRMMLRMASKGKTEGVVSLTMTREREAK